MPDKAVKVAGVAMRNALMKHFREKNNIPNKLGGQKTNFWAAVATATGTPKVAGSGVSVFIQHPHLAAHVYGATITPKKAKKLAIPVHPEAHGKRPRIIPGLKLAFGQKGAFGLKRDGELYYRFAKKAKIKNDDNALPKNEVVITSVRNALDILFRRYQ